jgi:hypothetical protein
MFRSDGSSLLRAEDFFCFERPLWIVLIQKFFFSCIFFFSFLLSKLWIRVGIQPKMLDPKPCQMNTDPKHCFFVT